MSEYLEKLQLKQRMALGNDKGTMSIDFNIPNIEGEISISVFIHFYVKGHLDMTRGSEHYSIAEWRNKEQNDKAMKAICETMEESGLIEP